MNNDISARMAIVRKNLPIIRLLYGWTQEDLGKSLGVSRVTINHIESGSMTKMQFNAVLNVVVEEYANSDHDISHEVAAALYNDAWAGKESKWKVGDLVFTSEKFRQWLMGLCAHRWGAKANAEIINHILSTKQIEQLEEEDDND